jgi:dihydropteroate synthase
MSSKAEVMRAAVNAGACLINDVRALREPGALQAAADCAAYVCLMHMQGQPRTMQQQPQYDDVVAEVCDFLSARVDDCVRAGILTDKILLDPGFGFGKSLQHNLLLLNNTAKFVDTKLPVLVGLSRKSMFGQLLGLSVDDRLSASLAAAVMAVNQGAKIVRAHDVKETVQAVALCAAVMKA